MGQLTLAQKSYFLRKTCFAAAPSYLGAIENITEKEELVDNLFQIPSFELDYPDWYVSPPDTSALNKKEKRNLRKQQSSSLRRWWKDILLYSSSPFEEVMVLFWHNHFVSSLKKVKSPHLMLRQNDFFRKNALGSFVELLDGVLKDPAMLIYLDNHTNKKQAPNENLARELLELFTLGEGNYSELDIKEIARALTGATVNKKTGDYQFKRNWHDNGEKTIFGESGRYSVEDLAELIVKQSFCPPFIVKKLWRYFIGEEFIEEEIEKLSATFKESNYNIKVLLKALFLTDAFWLNHGKMIKSPVHLIIGTYRQFELTNLKNNHWFTFTKNMGQQLFNPPNVKGWQGGKAWYASASIYYRELFVVRFLKWQKVSLVRTLPETLLSVNSVASLPDKNHAHYLSLVMNDPAYQVI